MGAKLLDHEGDRWAVSMEELWRAAPALARRARRYRLAPFGGSPARRCLSGPLDGGRLSQLVKEELSACRAADRHRYNFDFETLRPLEGRFLWQPVSPPPALVRTSSQQQEADSAGPESLLVRPAPELGRRAADATDRVVADGHQTKETSIAAPRYTDTTGEWRRDAPSQLSHHPAACSSLPPVTESDDHRSPGDRVRRSPITG